MKFEFKGKTTDSLFDIIKDIAESNKDFVAERIKVDKFIDGNTINELDGYVELAKEFDTETHLMKLIIEASSNSVCIIKKKKPRNEIKSDTDVEVIKYQ